MGLTDTNIPNSSADLMAVYDSKGNQVFSGARPVRNQTKPTSRPMGHPLETGVIITDHRIILPVEIYLNVILKAGQYRSVYKQIEQLFLSGELLTVQGKTATHKQMIIAECPYEEDPELFNTITMGIKLKEAQFVTAQFGNLPASSVRNPVQQDTIQLGAQQAGPPITIPPAALADATPPLPGTSALPQVPVTVRPIVVQANVPTPPGGPALSQALGAAQ